MASLPPRFVWTVSYPVWNLLFDDQALVLHVGRKSLVMAVDQQVHGQQIARLHEAQVANRRIRLLTIPLHTGGDACAWEHGPDDVGALEVQAIVVDIGVPLAVIGDDCAGAILVVNDDLDMVQVEVDTSHIDEVAHCYAPFRTGYMPVLSVW